MKTKEEIIKLLAALKPELQSRYKVKGMGVFGSLIRGEQTEASDVDLLVDFEAFRADDKRAPAQGKIIHSADYERKSLTMTKVVQ